MNHGDVLRYILKEKSLTVSKFALMLDVSRAAINNYFKTETFQQSTLDNILLALNIDESEWEQASRQIAVTGPDDGLIPIYNATATMSISETWPEGVTPVDRISVNGYEGCIGIYASGESMQPTIPDGSLVFCREIMDRSMIAWGEVYVVLTLDMLLIKRVYKGDDPDSIWLMSDAYKPADSYYSGFSPIEISRSKIIKLFLVRGYEKKLTS